MDNRFKIGNFLAELRKEKKLTQFDLAEYLGVSDRAVSKWENSRCLPETKNLKKLANLYNVSINELLLGERTTSIEKQNDTLTTLLNEKKNLKTLFYSTFFALGVLLALTIFYFATSTIGYKPSSIFFAVCMVAILVFIFIVSYYSEHLDKIPFKLTKTSNSKSVVIKVILVSFLALALGVLTFIFEYSVYKSSMLVSILISVFNTTLLPALLWDIFYLIKQIKFWSTDSFTIKSVVLPFAFLLCLFVFPILPAVFYYMYNIKLIKSK